MSTGTCCFAMFLCYYCLSYVLSENASPVAGWAGMLAYIAIALVLLRLDMKLKSVDLLCNFLLMVAPALISGVVTFAHSKHAGDVGILRYVIPLAPFLHGLWFVYYLSKFQMQELES